MTELCKFLLFLLFHHYTRHLAVGCIIISFFLILRTFTISSHSGRRRLGKKSFAFIVTTASLVFAIRYFQKHRVEVAYEQVHFANQAIMNRDQAYRTASASFQTNLEGYSTTLATFDPQDNARNQLIVLGAVAGKTRALGESLLLEYNAVLGLAKDYQSSLLSAQGAYDFAGSSLKACATEEEVLMASAEEMRLLASNEEFEELSMAYEDLAVVFQELSKTSKKRYQEIEVSLPILEEAMHYVKRANRYLATIERHAAMLSSFTSPRELLDEAAAYGNAVQEMMKAIRGLKSLLLQTDVKTIQASL